MNCLYCAKETKVTNSRLQRRSNQTWRRRQCKACKAILTTHEAIDLPSALLVDSGGSPKPFLPDRLYTEVLLALQDRKDFYQDAREVTNTIIKNLLKLSEIPLLKPSQVSQVAGGVLKRFDRRAWLRYVSDHPSLQS